MCPLLLRMADLERNAGLKKVDALPLPLPPKRGAKGMPATAGGCITGGGGTVDGNSDAAGGFEYPKELLTTRASKIGGWGMPADAAAYHAPF